MTEYTVPVVQVPGWMPALNAFVAKFGGECLDETIEHVTLILAVATPHIRAEALADLADELADHFPDVAEILDHASHDMRRALTR